MAKYHESTPLNQRLSKNIDVWHYVKEIGPAAAAIVVGMGANYLQNRAAPGSAKARTLGIVSMVALAISPFLVWRKKEKENLGINDLYENYKDARALRMDNAAIAHDNAVLKDMIAYEERQMESPKHVQEILTHGPKKHVEHALAETAETAASR